MPKLLNFLSKLNLNKTLLFTGITALAFLVAFLFWWQGGSNIIGVKNEDQKPRASLTGLVCDSYARRPMAVMMASDPIARPLSGISQADIVIEMPVTPNGITRMMAVFQCEPFDNAQGEPEEIGSVRSAREDFLPFVSAFKAIYAHWGGEKEALKKLDNGILNNVDAMRYEGTIFYRKNSAPRPHNGFTNMNLLTEKAKDLGYDLNDSFPGFVREAVKQDKNLSNIAGEIPIDYEKPYDVRWSYDSNTNIYKRMRGSEAEIDTNIDKQVETSVVILMHTSSRVLSKDYISVATIGEGEAEFYQNGVKMSGSWKNNDSGLKFYNTTGGEMEFIPGKMWIEIITK